MKVDEIQHATLGMTFLKWLLYFAHLSGVIRSSQNFSKPTISSSFVFDVTCFLRYKVCPGQGKIPVLYRYFKLSKSVELFQGIENKFVVRIILPSWRELVCWHCFALPTLWSWTVLFCFIRLQAVVGISRKWNYKKKYFCWKQKRGKTKARGNKSSWHETWSPISYLPEITLRYLSYLIVQKHLFTYFEKVSPLNGWCIMIEGRPFCQLRIFCATVCSHLCDHVRSPVWPCSSTVYSRLCDRVR